ncbi:hypothetical protein [Oceanospirillum sediminis]|uniref:Uncharacterized protein n=1 Tax=Oceanospirillum sediminis TaxID=2760088 RepID=A0A839IUW7_9GAMM|nr:hypothetical protein [Oceanospirillum sediminis]MBB1488414.1 hypothetical protein [Oceanospirillum sediminis]
MLKSFLVSYASLPLRHHFVVSLILLTVMGSLKLLLVNSAPDGIWWQALSTINLFMVITALMYGAIIFSQIMASACALVMQVLMPGENAIAAGAVLGVILSAVLILLMAPYLLDLIWRL